MRHSHALMLYFEVRVIVLLLRMGECGNNTCVYDNYSNRHDYHY